MSNLALNRIVRTTVTLTAAGAQAQSTSDMLVLGNSNVIDTTERMRTYTSLPSVAADFGTTADEYYAARRWFGQAPQPEQVRIGRWAKTATAGALRCAPLSVAQQALANFTAITAGAFDVTVDGTLAHITALNFSGAGNLNAVAAIIDTAFTGGTCVWNATYGRFEFTSGTTGATSAVSFLVAPGSGVDAAAVLHGKVTDSGAYTVQGLAAEALDACLALFDDRFGQLWYAAGAETGSDGDQQLAAAYIEAALHKHIWCVTTQSAGTIIGTDTTCLAYLLKASNYSRTMVQYSSTDAYAVFSAAGRIVPTDYDGTATTMTLKFKVEPGVVAEQLGENQANAAEAKNANIFTTYDNGLAIIEQGVMASGEFIDNILGTDWFALDIQNRVVNLLYSTPTKIPQTDEGVGIIVATIAGSCAQAENNGLLGPGVWDSAGFGTLKQGDFLPTGYYIYAQPIALQDPADRAARKAPPIQVAGKLAGAIHSCDISIVCNR